jgi:hypothetical protein
VSTYILATLCGNLDLRVTTYFKINCVELINIFCFANIYYFKSNGIFVTAAIGLDLHVIVPPFQGIRRTRIPEQILTE